MSTVPANVWVSPRPSDVSWTHVIYALHATSVALGILTHALVITAFIFGVPSIIAVIMNYVKRSDVRGTYLESHFRWQIRTFWFAVLWGVIAFVLSLPLMLVLVGFLTLWMAAVVVGIWVVYRVVRGWLRLSAAQPMYV